MSEEKGKISIKKILIAVVSLAMVVGFVFLFMSASRTKSEVVCKGLSISYDKRNIPSFVDTALIRRHILADKALNPQGKNQKELDLRSMSDWVSKQGWVKDAAIYMGNNNLLNIKITQSRPVARVFEVNGSSFYLDEFDGKISASKKLGLRIPVFTGYPLGVEKSRDSILLPEIRTLSRYISDHEFWKAQIDQIEILPGDEFALTPHVGDAQILFGRAEDMEGKFDKLLTFYKDGLQKVGWGHYEKIDVRYKDQIVATRKKSGVVPLIDSLARKNNPPVETEQEIVNN